MAAWRRKVLALFPELRVEAQRPEFTIYSAFFHLLPEVRLAHQGDDEERLRRIYGFAEWCFERPAKALWNAAGVAFYEHLFDSHPSLWPKWSNGFRPGSSRVARACGSGASHRVNSSGSINSS